MMKELLISFFICLVVGAFLNGNNSGAVKTPTPLDATSQAAAATTAEPGAAEPDPFAAAAEHQETTDSEFSKDVLDADTPVLVDFSASWCGPCQQMVPIVDQVAMEYKGKVKVLSVDGDMNPMLKAKFNIDSYPTFVIFKDGKQVTRFSGARPKGELVAEIEKVI